MKKIQGKYLKDALQSGIFFKNNGDVENNSIIAAIILTIF